MLTMFFVVILGREYQQPWADPYSLFGLILFETDGRGRTKTKQKKDNYNKLAFLFLTFLFLVR